MALGTLQDVIDIEVWGDLEPELDPELTVLWESGIVAEDDMFTNKALAPGESGELNYWRDVDHDQEENLSTDTNVEADPQNVVQGTMSWRKQHMNQVWGFYDLERELQSNTDAMQHVKNRSGRYWIRRKQQRLISTSIGIWLANVAGNFDPQIAADSVAGDMVNDDSIDNAGAPTAINLFNRDGFIDTVFTMGDRSEMLGAMIMHSVVHKTVVKLEDHEYVMDSTGRTRISTYMGRPIIVSDKVPFIQAGTSGFRYVTLIYGSEAFGYGPGQPKVPVAIDRNELQGNGGGNEWLVERKTILLHPIGHTNLNAAVTGPNYADGTPHQQTNADLANPLNWRRTHLRKNVPIAFYVTNG